MPKVGAPTSAGQKVNELIIKNKLSAEEAIRQVLGDINAAIPQGAQIINQTLNYIEYRDKEGYVHKVQRNADANSPDFGRINDSTDRPSVLPLTQQFPGLQGTLEQAMAAVKGGLSGQLSQLTPEDLAKLEAISSSERQQLEQTAARTQGELITSLYGSGINRSTVANQAGADFSQALGIALGQQQSGAAQRQLGLQQFLSQLAAGTGTNILGTLTGQETERAGASGQLALGREQLDQQSTDAARNFLLEFDKFKATQNRSKLPGILSAIASLASAIPGVGPFIGAATKAIGSGIGGGSKGIPGYDY